MSSSGFIERPVHPNSTAARKWKRTTWKTNLWAEAAIATRNGDRTRADALRRRAARANQPDLHCS